LDCCSEGIDAVGGEVGAEVERKDEQEGFGCEEGVWAREGGDEGVSEAGCEASAGGGLCDDGAEWLLVGWLRVGRM
jgi:hypothetical protein